MLPALILTAALLAPAAQDATVAPAASAQSSATAVGVNAYHRDYEGPQTDSEMRYNSNIMSAFSSKEGQMGLEGSWLVATSDGRKLVGLELRTDGSAGGRLDGAWRSMLAGFGMNDSGFVSNIALTGRELEINYFPGKAHSPNILQVHRDADGSWRGSLLDPLGHRTAIVMSRALASN